MDDRKLFSIQRDDNSPRANAPWKVAITTPLGDYGSSSNVEYMTQGELLDIWNTIGVLFNLAGMGEGITDAELHRRGIRIKTATRDSTKP